jgi:3-dehydroquinate dehydratase/shikimate dehydrogenase
LRDNLEAFDLLQQRHKPTIALCMGEFGLPSRILAKKFGALLTFAALDADQATAPGQPTIDELKTRYRWDKLNEDTQVYGVIGWPVGHSMSPHIHNAGFDAVDHNGVYLPMPIPAEYEHFKASVGAWLDFPPLRFRGASVTIPHKENLLRFVKERGGEIEPLAQTIGAANTLTVRDDGSLYAANTDYAAALDAVCAGVGVPREELNEFRVAVIGAGGAARAIVAGFADCGATVVIYNRTFEKAEALAKSFKDAPGHVVAARMEKLCDSCCHIFINCTPIGMHPHVDATPMPLDLMKSRGEAWGPGTVVFDTVYNPVQTKLLHDARKEGCVTIPGAEMFVRQAAGQFGQWTGVDAPLNLFRDVVHEELEESG